MEMFRMMNERVIKKGLAAAWFMGVKLIEL